MNYILQFIEQNQDAFLNQLFEFLRFPSISSRSEHKDDVHRCARWLADHMKSLGIGNVNVFETLGHPIVYGEWFHSANSPTILVYGHYDVQPVDPLNLWETPPFEPSVRNGKIYARGSSDDKGQMFMHLKAFETLLRAEGNVPINIKFLFEGEEEAGSNHLDDFVEKNPEQLKCDVVVISDTEWFADGLPSICYALRGIVLIEVKVIGPNRDLHSGSFGGAVDNPAEVLAWLITQLKDRYGRITIPGFYDNVLPLSEEERNAFRRLPFDESNFRSEIGVGELFGEIGYSTLERIWARPTLEINGIVGGYTGEGAKTIIPSEASAKISMRLVPNQTASEISEKFIKHIQRLAPPTVKIETVKLHGGNPVMTPIDSIWIKKAQIALKQAFGVEPVFMREGGSIPVCETFQRVLGASPVLLGFGLPGDNVHSPNESFSINNFFGGIKAIALYYKILGQDNQTSF
jgi:acetylornithine deacetylase/succinyl-diaminopimelate desuccinylase-like protein